MAEELDLIGEVLKSNSIRRDNTLYDYSLVNGQLQIIKEPGVMDAVSDVAGVIGDVVGQGVKKVGDVAQSTFEGTKGVVKGVPIGLSNFAKEFNKTFLPGYEENVVPFLQENIPGLKSLNNFVGDIFEYKNKAQEIGGEFIGEPIGEFGVTGGAIGGVAKSAGIGNRFLANVLGYGTAEVIAVPADEQGLLSMGIEYLSPDSPVTTAILESLKSDEDQSTFIQKLQKAPENFFVGGVVGEQLDKAVQGVGTLYKYIKNSPKLESIKQELKGGISTLGDTAREFLDKNRGGTTLGSTDIPKIVAEGTKALDEMVNPPFYKTPPNTPERAEEIRKLREEFNQNKFGTPTPNEPNIIAFHGSGADFDEFKVEKIGTGEGNQAFGYGLYFTESKDIAKFYKSSVGAGNEVTYKGKTVRDLDKDNASYEENIAHMVGQQNNAKDRQRVFDNELSSNMNSLSGIEQAIKDFNTDPDTYPLKFRGLSLTMDDALRIKNDFAERVSALKELEKNLDTIKTKPRGKLYKVGIAPKESELLDYDAPIGEQNEFIKTRLKKLVEEINLDDAINLGFDPFTIGEAQALQKAKENMLDPQRSVVSFLNDWAVFRGEQSTAEKLLDKYGIKGIRYKANQGVGARNVPETGKNNYVIFDDNLIKVMAKYGIVGPVALTAVASQKEGDDG